MRILTRERFDIVHIHAEARNLLTAALARASGARVVRTVHNVFAFQGALRRSKALQRSLLTEHLDVLWVAPGKAVAINEAERFGNLCETIDNWYDDSRFTPTTAEQQRVARERLGVPPDSPVIVSVGNCAPAKGHGRVLAALSALPEDVFYIHVGAGPDLVEERQLAAALSVAERCYFAPRDQDVRTALQAADVFVMPSRYEGLPIAALEALGMGLPCVFTDVPGLNDLTVPSASIAWVPQRSDLAPQVRACLAQLPDDYRLRESRSKEVRARFGSERGALQYVRVYEQLLAVRS
jgi:glycosyltransferase involved in cell wall biosynthesis